MRTMIKRVKHVGDDNNHNLESQIKTKTNYKKHIFRVPFNDF